MKYVFLGCFVFMGALTAVAWLWQPADNPSKIELLWCSDDNPARREQIELFNELHPKYHLELDPSNNEMTKVIVQCLAGVGPDLFDCYNGFQLGAFVRSGIALDLTEEFARRGIDMDEAWSCTRPVFEYEDRIYGHPENAGANAVWYNKRLFDEAHEPYPQSDWTWAEFIGVAQRLTKRDAQGRLIQLGFVGYWDWQTALVQWGGRIYTPEGTRCVLDSPEGVAAMQFMQDLIYEHHVMPTPAEETALASQGGWGTGTMTLFGGARGAMALGGRWWLCNLRKPDYAHLRLGAVEIPQGPYRRILGYGKATLINARSKKLEGALAFQEFLHSQEWSELINRQADALAPVKKYNYTELYLHDPEFPDEDYNAVWRNAMEYAIPQEVSIYVNGQTVDRILLVQTDLVRANLKPAADAMRDATRKINEAIIEQIKLDPELRRKYYKDLAKGAQPAWDSPQEEPAW